MTHIDLNADVGEGMSADAALFPLITSANIACGAHAGSPEIIRSSVRRALAFGVAIGAHPGFVDREHFGRRALSLASDDVSALVGDQVRLVRSVAEAEGGTLTHVKPHGALYNVAATDAALADAIARAVVAIDPGLVLVGLAGSELVRAGTRLGLPTASEAFADRTYQSDGTLVPRGSAKAVIVEVSASVTQAVSIVRDGTVRSTDGHDVRLHADTICIHGDAANAALLARAIRSALDALGVVIAPLGTMGGRT